MAYEKKVALKCPNGYKPALDQIVEDFLKDEVWLVAVIGKDCTKVEDIIDELIVRDGSNQGRFIVTTSHLDKLFQEVIEFAESFVTNPDGNVQIVEL
ncbi:MAG: hypothetical protein AB7T38_08090 [Nitrospirales bacterium]